MSIVTMHAIDDLAAIEQLVRKEMTKSHAQTIIAQIARIRTLTNEDRGTYEFYQAGNLAMTVLYETVGGRHPVMVNLREAMNAGDWVRVCASSRTVLDLFDQGALFSPRLAIAREIEGEILDLAQAQLSLTAKNTLPEHRQVQLAVAAFLAGAALEDALRRLCDTHGVAYDTQKTSLSKLQAVLFQPSKDIEVISSSENKQITAWGDTRNKADHGKFIELTEPEVTALVIGTRGLIERHFPS